MNFRFDVHHFGNCHSFWYNGDNYEMLIKNLPSFLYRSIVTYWPSIQPSIEKQLHLVEDIKVKPWHLAGWIRCKCNAHRKQVDFKQWYNAVARRVELVGVKQLKFELQFDAVRISSQQRAGPQDPRLSSPPEWEKKCCWRQRNLGSICYSLFSLQLTSHT